MSLAIYKPGQGYWTRMLTAIGAGILIVAGAAFLWRMLTQNVSYMVQAAVSGGTIVVGAGVLWWLLNHPRIVDFMVATEAEMRKVNWPSRREVMGSTWLVICGALMMAGLLFFIDEAFWELFYWAGVLEAPSFLRQLLETIYASLQS